MGGGNVVCAQRNLQADALASFLANYSQDHQTAIAARIRSGKNAMPSFVGKLSESEIQAAAAYVDAMALQGWHPWPRSHERT